MNPQRAKILAIDDVNTNLLILGAVLNADYDLQIATSGAQGLALANATPPDLILLDVMMPEMDGYEVCRRLKADPRLQAIPVIFITALTDAEGETKGLALGAEDYLSKPINVEITRQRIRNLLEREKLRKEIEAHRDDLEALVQARTAELEIAKEAAEAANRAKTVFLATMSHELRTPINGMLGMTELALRKATDPKQADWLGKGRDSALRLLALVNDVLEISNFESGQQVAQVQQFSIAALLDEIEQTHLPLASKKGLRMQFDHGLDLPAQLNGDVLRLKRILDNYLSNAIKFSEQGEISLHVHIVGVDERSVVLRFEVSDQGIGISQQEQSKLFAAFTQLDGSMTRKYGGSGLGLYICKRLAETMGAEVGVDSELGQGSRFWLNVRMQLVAEA